MHTHTRLKIDVHLLQPRAFRICGTAVKDMSVYIGIACSGMHIYIYVLLGLQLTDRRQPNHLSVVPTPTYDMAHA